MLRCLPLVSRGTLIIRESSLQSRSDPAESHDPRHALYLPLWHMEMAILSMPFTPPARLLPFFSVTHGINWPLRPLGMTEE